MKALTRLARVSGKYRCDRWYDNRQEESDTVLPHIDDLLAEARAYVRMMKKKIKSKGLNNE